MRRPLAGVLVAGIVAVLIGCQSEEPQPIRVGTDKVTVINLTDKTWRNVDVWLNDHYRAQARELLPGQRLDIPMGVFIAYGGQYFNIKKQVPSGIAVEAVTADGKPVAITWGKGRRR